MRTSVLILLFAVGSGANAQDFKRGSDLSFEYPPTPTPTISGGRVRGYAYPAHPSPMLAVLATASRLSFYPTLSFNVAVEAETSIDGVPYRLFFPRIPPREAPYVFAVARSPSRTDRAYFEIPREGYTEFARLFLSFLNGHSLDPRQ
jgi:hypothetical protein